MACIVPGKSQRFIYFFPTKANNLIRVDFKWLFVHYETLKFGILELVQMHAWILHEKIALA